jgi:hypothetical protein
MTFDGVTADPMQQAVRDALIGFMADRQVADLFSCATAVGALIALCIPTARGGIGEDGHSRPRS